MAFCESCGGKVNQGAKFCPQCGKAAGAAASSEKGKVVKGEFKAAEAEGEHDNQKLFGIISYLGLWFIPLLTGDYKKSPFIKYHVNQSLVLFIGIVIWWIVYAILMAIFTAIVLSSWRLVSLYPIIAMLLGLVWIVPLALAILGIINVVKEEMKPLPVIGKFTILK